MKNEEEERRTTATATSGVQPSPLGRMCGGTERAEPTQKQGPTRKNVEDRKTHPTFRHKKESRQEARCSNTDGQPNRERTFVGVGRYVPNMQQIEEDIDEEEHVRLAE